MGRGKGRREGHAMERGRGRRGGSREAREGAREGEVGEGGEGRRIPPPRSFLKVSAFGLRSTQQHNNTTCSVNVAEYWFVFN